MIIYQINLPKNQDTKAFVKFMREEYFPAVHKGQTRVGQVTDLVLLERQNAFEGDDLGNEFYWHVGWSGFPDGNAHVDDEKIAHKLATFKAEIKRIGAYEEVAVWKNHTVA
jgi:hypothetical protein